MVSMYLAVLLGSGERHIRRCRRMSCELVLSCTLGGCSDQPLRNTDFNYYRLIYKYIVLEGRHKEFEGSITCKNIKMWCYWPTCNFGDLDLLRVYYEEHDVMSHPTKVLGRKAPMYIHTFLFSSLDPLSHGHAACKGIPLTHGHMLMVCTVYAHIDIYIWLSKPWTLCIHVYRYNIIYSRH